MNVSRKLASMAKKFGICEDWYLELKNEKNTDRILDMYLRGIDFCLANNFPSNEFIRDNFKGKINDKGIYLDSVLIAKDQPKVVILGSCLGRVETKDFDVCEVFIKDNSEIVITASGNSFVMVDVFDNAKLTVYSKENANVCVNLYGGNIIQNAQGKGKIKVIRKNKTTY